MVNPIKGEALFAPADGEPLTFVFDHHALISLEEVLDRPLPGILAELVPGPDGRPRLVRHGTSSALTWAGLRLHHPGVTIEQAGALVLGHGAPLTLAVFKALERAFPTAEAAKDGPPPRAVDGTGSIP